MICMSRKLRFAARARLGRLILMAAAILAVAAAALAQETKLPPPPADLPGHVAYLGQQLWGVPMDESEPLTSQIEKLALDHLNEWLASHPPGELKPGDTPYDVKARRELERVFAGLRFPVYANVNTFERPFGNGQLLAIGYTLGWSDFDRANVITLYQVQGAAPQQAAVTHFIPDVDIHYRFFDPPPSAAGQFWFLIYGTRLGKSNPRLSAELYAFDGQNLKSLWKTQDVYDGKISFPARDRVVVNYLREDEFRQAIASRGPVVRHEAAYHITPSGFEAEYDH
jgi:hypothetical protein